MTTPDAPRGTRTVGDTPMIVVFALAQIADMGSALLMPPEFESNPIVRLLLGQPIAAIAVKIAVIVLGIAIATIIARTKPRLALWVYATGTVVGFVGLLTNLAVLRALTEGV